MGLFSNIKAKVASTLMGDLVTDLGTLPINENGREISLSIRRHPGKPAHLQVKLSASGEASYFQITNMKQWADQFEKVAQEMRKHTEYSFTACLRRLLNLDAKHHLLTMNLKTSIRIAVYLLLYLGVPVIASMVKNQTIAAVLGIVYIFILIPIGILLMIDFYRTNNGTSLPARIFNALFRVPLALFGLVCLVGGFTIIGWVLYNVFIEQQKQYTGPNYVLGLGSFGIGIPLVLFGWYTLRKVARRKEELTPEEQEEFEHEEDDEEHAPS